MGCQLGTTGQGLDLDLPSLSLGQAEKLENTFNGVISGPETIFFPREPNCIFKCYLKVLCLENSTSLGSLEKCEGAARALGSRHPLISSPEFI